MMPSCRILAAALAASAAGSCSEPAPPPATFDLFLGEFAKALCRADARCGGAASEASCLAATNLRANLSTAQLAEAARAGRIKYNPGGAASLLSLVGASGCHVLDGTAFDKTWASMLAGLVPEGELCWLDEECASGGDCQASMCDPSGRCCRGACVARPAEIALGSDCTTGRCVAGSTCLTDGAAPICQSDLGEGKPCGGTIRQVCAEGTVCRPDAEGKNACRKLPEEGASCKGVVGSVACARRDNFCNIPTLICKRRLAAAATCTPGSDHCVTHAPCIAGVCKARPSPGQMCDPNRTDIRCLGNGKCEPSTAQCVLETDVPACV